MTTEDMFEAAGTLRQVVISDEELDKALEAYALVMAFFDGHPGGGLIRKALIPEQRSLAQMKNSRKS
jgi:hypothetical protein